MRATLFMSLQAADVPGASLQGRDPSELKVPELKRWLECRAASTSVMQIYHYKVIS